MTEESLAMDSFGGFSAVCEACEKQMPSIRCLQCSHAKFLCSSCDHAVHQNNPLHDRDAWIDGYYKPLLPTEGLDSSGNIILVGMEA